MAIKIISGGAGGGAVLAFGLDRGYRVGGFVPRGRLGDAPARFRPYLAEIDGDASHCALMRVTTADAVLVIGREGRDADRIGRLCAATGKPLLLADGADPDTPEVVRAWLARFPAWRSLAVAPVPDPTGRPAPAARAVLERSLWPKSVTVAVTAVPVDRGFFALAKFCYAAPDGALHTRAAGDVVPCDDPGDAAARAAARALAELKIPSAVWVVAEPPARVAASARHRVASSAPFDEASADLLGSAHTLATALAAGRSGPPPSPGAAAPRA